MVVDLILFMVVVLLVKINLDKLNGLLIGGISSDIEKMEKVIKNIG